MIVKICGVRSSADVDAAAAAGADWVGLNLWRGSRRHVDLPTARRLAQRTRALGMVAVGLLVEPTAAAIARAWSGGAFDLLQVYNPRQAVPAGVRWIRCLSVTDQLPDLAAPTDASFDLVEAEVAGHGGQGIGFDWALLGSVAFARRTLVAGGIRPDNIDALLRVCRPFGIDVASGVESAPGVKDPDKMRALVTAVRRFERRE
jgi:phosphoribosylanthranilate isomerase